MELILVRHALPVRHEVTEGTADPGLSEDGLAQSRHLADYLAAETIHAIYSSPMQRAVQTAAPLAERLGLPVTILEDVAEYDRLSTAWSGRQILSVNETPHLRGTGLPIGLYGK